VSLNVLSEERPIPLPSPSFDLRVRKLRHMESNEVNIHSGRCEVSLVKLVGAAGFAPATARV
jgi:hypothetical protein